MMTRKYLPTLAELIDRLSIVILKTVFIPENASEYEKEQELIMHDIDILIRETQDKQMTDATLFKGAVNHDWWLKDWHPIVNAKMIRAILILMLTNRYIWENESKARLGGSQQDKLLKLTHSINGIRNTAKNVIAHELGERKDLKIDSLAENLLSEFGNWNLFGGVEQETFKRKRMD